MSTHDDRIPWVTWLSGAAAIVVLCVAAFVLLSPVPGPQAAAAARGREEKPETRAPAASSSTASEPGAGRHALDISPALVDARLRASKRLEGAALAGVRLIIDGGKPLGQIEVTYAATRGRPLPGDPVTAKRLRISYEYGPGTPGAPTEVEEKDSSAARVLTDPNCPFEAAFRAAIQSGAPESARYFAVYAHSVRHRRPMWTLTSADGAAYHVDAGNCALLVR